MNTLCFNNLILILLGSASYSVLSSGVGEAPVITRLVPILSEEWKAHVVYTNLESLTGFPENFGPLRNQNSNHGKMGNRRGRKKMEFVDSDPVTIIIGGD